MGKLKEFEVTIERKTVKTETATVTIKAESTADAEVLARYRELNSWDWNAGSSVEHLQAAVHIVEMFKVEPAAVRSIEAPAIAATETEFM